MPVFVPPLAYCFCRAKTSRTLNQKKKATFCDCAEGFPVQDDCERRKGISTGVFGGVMAIVMGVVTMVRVTRNMPTVDNNVLCSGPVYYTDVMKKGHGPCLPPLATSSNDYSAVMKRMTDLEEKITLLSKKPATMPAEKEEMLVTAVKRVDALEQQLSAVNKVNRVPLIRDQ